MLFSWVSWSLLAVELSLGQAQQTQQQAQQTQQQLYTTFIDESIFRQRPERLALLGQPRRHDYADEVPEYPFEGLATFAHLPQADCFSPAGDGVFDIAIVGAPFDLGVSYRPGARFGPAAARMGSRRLSPAAGYSIDHRQGQDKGRGGQSKSRGRPVNPFRDWATVVDCGDIYNTPFDKLQAIHELQKGWEAIGARQARNRTASHARPRIISIGGDHTISLPAIRALVRTWGRPVTVLHFDSHLDSWDPRQLGGGLSRYAEVNHGTMFHILHEEGLLAATGNMHLGVRCLLFDAHYDLDHDARCGFSYVRARELDELGTSGVVERMVEAVGDSLVYVSLDIDVLDPAFTPATGTIEPGGWTTREILQILDGLAKAGVQMVGADVVEFAPMYDNRAETTALVVSQIVYELLQWMVRVPVA